MAGGAGGRNQEMEGQSENARNAIVAHSCSMEPGRAARYRPAYFLLNKNIMGVVAE
jgi:hypothetical protein